MKYILLAAIAFGSLGSCKNSKKAQATQFESEGFEKATVLDYSDKDNTCDFVLQLENGNFIIPVALKDDFKKDNTKVWVKHSPSKIMQKCKTGTPAVINDIRTRK